MKERTNKIIEQATTLFMLKGVHSVSMENISAYCGISKKTLYGSFQSKEILVETIVQKLIMRTEKYLRLCPDISPNAVIEIENFSKHMLLVLETITPRFIRDLKKYYHDAYMQLVIFKNNSVIRYLERCLTRGINEEIFRTRISKRNIAWHYCWQLQSLLEGDTSTADLYKIIEQVNDLFLHGIVNVKGQKLISIYQ